VVSPVRVRVPRCSGTRTRRGFRRVGARFEVAMRCNAPRPRAPDEQIRPAPSRNDPVLLSSFRRPEADSAAAVGCSCVQLRSLALRTAPRKPCGQPAGARGRGGRLLRARPSPANRDPRDAIRPAVDRLTPRLESTARLAHGGPTGSSSAAARTASRAPVSWPATFYGWMPYSKLSLTLVRP
jgi:hypothetical protein